MMDFLFNWGGVIFIPIIAIILIGIEVFCIFYYREKEFSLTNQGIQFLKNKQNKEDIIKAECDKEDKDLFYWLTKHLEGDIFPNQIIPKKDKNNYYILSSYPSILTQPIPRSPVYYAPTLLTALGILGTFLGIFLGLQKVGTNIGDTQTLLASSNQLLEGMKTAFSTSLAGLGSASLMMIFLALGGKFRQDKRNKVRKELSTIAYLESSQKLLSRLDTSGFQEISQSLNNLTVLSSLTPENIALAIKSAIASDDGILVQQLQAQTNHLQTLTPTSFASILQPLITPIQEEIKSLKQIQIEQQSTVQLLVRELRNELIEPVVQRLDQSAKLTEEASLAVKELKEELGGIAESLAGAVQTIQEFQQDTLTKLQQFAQSLQQILNQFGDDTKGVLRQVATEINNAVAESIAGMEAQRQAFESSANQAANTFRGIREDLQEALTTQANQQKEMLEGVKQSTEDILQKTNEAFSQQTETIAKVGEEASQLMNQAKENLLSTLQNIDSMLQNTRETVQIELERFRLEYQVSLTDFFNKQNQLLDETLGRQKEGLAEVVNNLQTTFKEESETRKQLTEEVNQNLINFKETTRIVSNLVNATGMNSSERYAQLQELAETLGNEAEKVETAYQQMTNQFRENSQIITNEFKNILGEITQEFDLLSTKTNQQISEYLSKASETYSHNFKQADSAMAEICSKLNDTSSELFNVAEYLVASANELTQSKQ
ncbi:hypothetical protein H6G11_04265 [Cyanobacterium aponinum FACHB-4101]|uniref:hypothetical protein n=1 Tax=Cyanobacterium aponinum TaxID=379064 RepID=UPI0016814223|nr:hypothetical protein [Cyanobacterium aponinum]MBD2393467.1 hypothetical protein [Cyanobacterium aponinum FACHB-4101]